MESVNFLGDEVLSIAKLDGSTYKTRITKLYSFEGLKRVDVTLGRTGDILAIAGVEGITIGETITSAGTLTRFRIFRSTNRRSR